MESNPTAAFFRMETNEILEVLPDLYQDLDALLPPEDSSLRRAVYGWFRVVAQKAFPGVIIPEEAKFEEGSMLEETMIKWREEAKQEGRHEGRQEGRREALREGQLLARKEMLLELMSQRFGRLPASIRRQVEEIPSIQELRKLSRKVLRAKSLEEMGLG